jgi:hypothetical protein
VDRSLRAEWAGLAGSRGGVGTFDAGQADELPEPARRWLAHAVPPGTPLWSSVELRMRGRIKLGAWRPFSAREVLAPPRGFVWAATTRLAGLPITGFDRYSSGTGEMRWRLLGLVPVMTAAGPDVTRSAAGRLAGEGTVWLPTAFAGARWTSGPDPDSAVATWHIGDQDESVQLRVGPDGALVEGLLHRWGNPDGRPFARYPFRVTVEAEHTFGGLTVPSVVRASWSPGDQPPSAGEFFRAEITGATYR